MIGAGDANEMRRKTTIPNLLDSVDASNTLSILSLVDWEE
jgi:hypothetical protein